MKPKGGVILKVEELNKIFKNEAIMGLVFIFAKPISTQDDVNIKVMSCSWDINQTNIMIRNEEYDQARFILGGASSRKRPTDPKGSEKDYEFKYKELNIFKKLEFAFMTKDEYEVLTRGENVKEIFMTGTKTEIDEKGYFTFKATAIFDRATTRNVPSFKDLFPCPPQWYNQNKGLDVKVKKELDIKFKAYMVFNKEFWIELHKEVMKAVGG